MRIALIHTPFYFRQGGERQILRLAIELQKMGHVTEIFTPGVDWTTYPEYFDKVKINEIPYPLTGKLPKALIPPLTPRKNQDNIPKETRKNIIAIINRSRERLLRQYYISLLPQMFELGRKIPKNFEIINNHNFPTEWAGFFAKGRLKVPLVWMCNEPPYWFFAPEIKKGLAKVSWPIFELVDKTSVQYVDEIMVLSHVSEGYVKKAYNRESKIVRTGVDAEKFHKASGQNLRRKYGFENSFVLLFVGSSIYARRSNIIRALALLSKKYKNIKLILDTSRDREMLTRLSEELGLKDKVLLLNSKNDLELAEVYAACDVFIYPASASPWGLVVTEAMAASKPVIVSEQVGTSEIIQNGVNGIIIDKATPEKIAEEVEKLLNDPELCQKIGENAYEYVKNYLSWERYAKTVESIFEETLSNQ